ncbi:MAG: ATP-binding cassette domain-containing protein [Gammaproteobacteria bacterium]|nr:ATP-binding cassette domain-containing protein [Gammaproteobacteria bacterium]
MEIKVEDVDKSFGKRNVLRAVNLVVSRGDIVAIVGPSGCGKTVLLNLVLGLLSPDRGRVLAVNHARKDKPLTDIARASRDEYEQIHVHWGVVFQRNALFSGTVYDNIALWLEEVRDLGESEIHQIAHRALHAVGLPGDDAFLSLDHGNLSGGMAKRLALARAIAMNPRVIFYDEPTTGLDPTSAAQIQDLIYATHHEASEDVRTTVIITHDKDLLSRLRPRTVMLHEGQVFFDDSFEKFFASHSGIIRPYFDLMPVLHEREVPPGPGPAPGVRKSG